MAVAPRQTHRLAVFDIDGTLTLTNRVDDRCFRAAHSARLGAPAVEKNWGNFSHMTDSCISREIFERIEGRPPLASETRAIQDDFVALLRAEYTADAAQFAPLSGATAVIEMLPEAAGWNVALASGGWRISAQLKLKLAGIEPDSLPGAFGDEFVSREEIVTAAIDRAAKTYGVEAFDRTVSIGDGAWDVVTAHNLGLPFIGITTENGAERLRASGAEHVLADYTDIDAVLDLLERAKAP